MVPQTSSDVGVEPICFVRNAINSTGEVALRTDSFWFIDRKPLFGAIDFSNVTAYESTEGGEIPSKNRPFNATILECQTRGLTRTTFQTSHIVTRSSDSGPYSTFEIPDNFRLVTNLANGATVNLTLSVNDSVVKLTVFSGSLAIDVFNAIGDAKTGNYENLLQICAKYPELQLTGFTFMEQAYLSTSPTSILAYGYPVITTGTTAFRIESVDQGTIRISDFSILGQLASQKPEETWNEWNVPWVQMLTSVYGVFFVISAVIAIFLFARIISTKWPARIPTKELKSDSTQVSSIDQAARIGSC
jgi:hypothetical protein